MENRTSSRKTRVGLVVSDKMDKTVAVSYTHLLLEEGHGYSDRGFQEHRVLRRHGVRRITNNGYQDL